MGRLSSILVSLFLLATLASALNFQAVGKSVSGLKLGGKKKEAPGGKEATGQAPEAKKSKKEEKKGEACIGKGFCAGGGTGRCVLSGKHKAIDNSGTLYGNEFGGQCVCRSNICEEPNSRNNQCRCNIESAHTAKTRSTFEAPTAVKNAQAGFKAEGIAAKKEGATSASGKKLTSSSGGSAGSASGNGVGNAFAKYDKKQQAEAKQKADEEAKKKQKPQVSTFGKMLGYQSRRRI